jgi:quercetin dioxygenase-like cupin family protein
MVYKCRDLEGFKTPPPFSRRITPVFMGDNDECSTNFSISITEFEPGERIDNHSHPNSMEAMYCLSGYGKALIGNYELDFVQDTLIVAKPGERHVIENIGSELLRVLCVFSPATTASELKERALKAAETNE